jgi:hypothetical protein
MIVVILVIVQMMEHLCQFFTIPTHLYESEQMNLTDCLKTHIDVFVTNELPNLGYADLVKIFYQNMPNLHNQYKSAERKILQKNAEYMLNYSLPCSCN